MSTFNLPSLRFDPHGVNVSGNFSLQSQMWADNYLASQNGESLFDFDEDDEEHYQRGKHNHIRSRVATLRNTAPNVANCVSTGWDITGGLDAFRRTILRMTQNNHFDGDVAEEEAAEVMTSGPVDRPPKLSSIFKILRKELDKHPSGNLYKQSEIMKSAFSNPVILSSIMKEYSRYVENDIKRVREEKYEARLRGIVCNAKHKVSLTADFNPECGMCHQRADATEHECLPKEKVITLIRSRIERWYSCNESNIQKCQKNGQTVRAGRIKKMMEDVDFTRVKQVRSAQNKTNPMIGIRIPSSEFSESNAPVLVLKTLMSLDSSQNKGRKRRNDRQLPVNFHTVPTILEHMKDCYMVDVDASRTHIIDSLKRFSQEALIDTKQVNGIVSYARISDDEREIKRRRIFEESERQRIESIEKEFVNREVSDEDYKKIGEQKVEELWENVLCLVPDCQSFGGFDLENGVKNEGPLFKIMNTTPDGQDEVYLLSLHLKERAEWIAKNNNREARELIFKFWCNNHNSTFKHTVLDHLQNDGPTVSAETIAMARSYYFWDLHHTRVATLNDYLSDYVKECKINNVW
jgi:hypothetical protein